MPIDRRAFLKLGGFAALSGSVPGLVRGSPATNPLSNAPMRPVGKADYDLGIGTSLIEVGPQRFLSMTAYNGQFPGPLLRFKEGRQVIVDIHNETNTPEQLHWHGQSVPDAFDGAAEEGTPYLVPHGMRRQAFVPGPAGFRFYHTHLRAGSDLSRGQYNGQVGPVYIEPRHEPGAYDREVFLTLKEFEPFFSQGGDMAMDFLHPGDREHSLEEHGEQAMKASLASGMKKGYEVGYRIFTINGRQLGFGEPVRVKRGERVLFHVLNGSATEIRSLALPGHTFRVVALDGNPVPHPAEVPVLWIGTAERISAIVEMTQPGVWVLGDLADDDRGNGMGIVIEYAGERGKPAWRAPAAFAWDYRRFADPKRPVPAPDETIDMLFAKDNAADHGFNRWTINGVAFDMATMPVSWHLKRGRRYRLRMRNATDDIHPIHLHRHSFEITRIAGQPTGGVIKDVAMLGGYQTMEVDFTADQPGLTLFHCHMQLHMDFGFMALFDCA
ncbi:multicopper oxidase family protein [Rhodanobacter humi]|uniref:Multicopper oxidase family protein n=1 Tax=Rhodanobacter humi TaxID=1888173 RepID=A0ABV4AN73_9GAMM|nr:MAG: copper oxidase [Rhodanobacter sp.]